jgi:hypothetical protein
MTDTMNRRTVLTGTAASAVAASVPASAAFAKPVPAGDLGTRYRDGIWSVATQMPRDARVWIDVARAAGLTVELGHANGTRGVFTGYNDVSAEVRDFLQSWGGAIPTGETVAELEREQPGENDRKLQVLVAHHRQFDRQEERIRTAPRPTRENEQRVDDWLEATSDAKLELLREAAKLEPETAAGAAALVTLIELDRLDGQPLEEQVQCEHVAAMVGNLLAFTKRQAGEGAA